MFPLIAAPIGEQSMLLVTLPSKNLVIVDPSDDIFKTLLFVSVVPLLIT
jgi:hypothetical protein